MSALMALTAIQTLGEGRVKPRKRGWFSGGGTRRLDFLHFVRFSACYLYLLGK
jgi:hypothetical protein